MADKPEAELQASEEVKTVEMAFVDQLELDPNMDEEDLIEEAVMAVEAGPNRWRLEQNPVWTEMAAYKDTVEGEVNEYGVFVVQRVVEKSGLRTIRTGVPKMFYFSDFGKAFLESVVEAGGMWDILFGGIFTYNVPKDRAEEFEDTFKVACREAHLLGKTERRSPIDLYRKHLAGGCLLPVENN